MIRILAVSLSAAALAAATVPASAQQGPGFRGPGNGSGVSSQQLGSNRLQQPGGERFRSFNPPAPNAGSSGQRVQRSFTPPAPTGGQGQVNTFSRGITPPTPGGNVTTQRSFGPQAPGGGRSIVGGPGSVPASLPAPTLGQSTPTAGPAPDATVSQQVVSAPDQTTARTTGQPELQAPLPETVTTQEGAPVPQGGEAPQQIVAQEGAPEGGAPTVAPTAPSRVVSKVVPGRKVYHGHVAHKVYQPRVVYVPVEVYHVRKVYRPHHVYVGHHFHGGHHVHRGHRSHYGFRGHGRW